MTFTALADGSCTFVNKRWTEYTGLSVKETVGAGWQRAFHPEDLVCHSEKWRLSVASGQLFENEAPNTVLNFITLVQRGYYDGLKFHRVLPGFMAQGGDPKGTGSGGPGYQIPCECYKPDYRLHYRGTLSMAHAGRDTGGSQFFLTFVPTSHLNGKHTAFGRIISGFDVLAKLKRIDPETSNGAAADKIIEAKVIRKRAHPYEEKDLKKSSGHD